VKSLCDFNFVGKQIAEAMNNMAKYIFLFFIIPLVTCF
jgi:hypothetical protein